MGKPRLISAPRCVLCDSCANYLGRSPSPERRRSARACAAGLAPMIDVPDCASYVSTAVHGIHALVPAWTRPVTP